MEVLLFIAVLGFIAWIITLPSVPIRDPFKSIIMGVLVLLAIVAILEAIGVLHTNILGSLNLH